MIESSVAAWLSQESPISQHPLWLPTSRGFERCGRRTRQQASGQRQALCSSDRSTDEEFWSQLSGWPKHTHRQSDSVASIRCTEKETRTYLVLVGRLQHRDAATDNSDQQSGELRHMELLRRWKHSQWQ